MRSVPLYVLGTAIRYQWTCVFGGRVSVIWSVYDENDLLLSHLLPVESNWLRTTSSLQWRRLLSQAVQHHQTERGEGWLQLAQPPKSSTGYGGLGHFTVLPAGCQQQEECPDEPAVCEAVSHDERTLHHPNDFGRFFTENSRARVRAVDCILEEW